MSAESYNNYSVWAAWSKSKAVRSSCASGGIFYTIASAVINHGGIVVGAAFDNDFNVRHIFVDNIPGLEALKKSKYVLSNIGGLFPKIKTALEAGQIILFSGTPCQVHALKRYLGAKYNNLICCSFLCYGTPEPYIYKAYINSLKKRMKSQIDFINFKDKRYGWDYYTTAVRFKNRKTICRFGGDSYTELMKRGYSLAKSCIDCRYDALSIDADIVLGDFYSVNKYLKCKTPRNGVSCVICKSEIGKKLIDPEDSLKCISIKSDMFFANEKPRTRNFDMQKRDEFKKTLAVSDYDTACKIIGITEQPLSYKQKLLAVKKRVGL